MTPTDDRAEFEAAWRARQVSMHHYTDRECPADWGNAHKPDFERGFHAAKASCRAEIESLRADAERLDWLQSVARCDPKMDGKHVWWPLNWNTCQACKGGTIREGIDAARATTGKGGRDV